MRRRNAIALIMLCCAVLVMDRPPAQNKGPAAAEKPRGAAGVFRTMDVWLNGEREPVTAYQVEVIYDRSRVKVVGVEGGESPAYQAAPYYDPAGMAAGRMILAAFTTDHEQAPIGRTRVARLHLRVDGDEEPMCVVRLMVAARPGGERIYPVTHAVHASKKDIAD